MIDAELILQVFLVLAAALVLVSLGAVAVSFYCLNKAYIALRRARRGPFVVRDGDGRPTRERI